MNSYIVDKEKIAEICHEVNKTFCESIGDYSQKSWKETSANIRNSAINGVDFHLKNNTTPEQSHENWMKFKIENGWVYGKEKDEKKKTHPCLVPYNKLSKEQQTKDYLFKKIVDCFKFF